MSNQIKNDRLLKRNRNAFDIFYTNFYEMYITRGSGAYKERAVKQKERIKENIDKQLESVIRGYDKITDYDANTLYESKNVIDSFTGLTPPIDPNEIDIYKIDGKYIDTASLWGNDVDFKSLEGYNNILKEFGQQCFQDSKSVNRALLDWKTLDIYQDNIGSVKSITEFFFNMMMCYNSSVITKKVDPKGNIVPLETSNSSDWYVPLPDEWIEDGGLLDKMIKTNTSGNSVLNKLKKYGIPFGVNRNTIVPVPNDGQMRANDIVSRNGAIKNQIVQDPGYTLAIAPGVDVESIGLIYSLAESQRAYEGGAFFTPFVSPVEWLANRNPNGNTDDDLGGIRGVVANCNGGGGIGHYFGGHAVDMTANDNLFNITGYFGNRYRMVYDIVYSNAAFTKVPPGWTLAVRNAVANQDPNVGGFVSICGSIPQLDRSMLRYDAYDLGQNLGVMATNAQENIAFPSGSINNVTIEPRTNIWYNTARTAYNSLVLNRWINQPPNLANTFDRNKITGIDNTKLTLQSLARTRGNPLSTLFTAGVGQSLATDPELLNNLLLSNYGFYLKTYTTGNDTTDPSGFLRCREVNKVNQGNINNIKNHNRLPDSIISESGIDAIIKKFADLIYNINHFNLGDTYRSKINTPVDIDLWKERFIYRLSRSIKIVREILFEAPIPNEYSDRDHPDNFLTKFERDAWANKGAAAVPVNTNNYGATIISEGGPTYSSQLWGNITGGSRAAAPTYQGIPDRPSYKDKFTDCKGQPLTLAFTTEFRQAFSEMVNKAIVIRQEPSSTMDSSKVLREKWNDAEYVTWCTGRCRHLIKLDVSSILNIKITKSDGRTPLFNLMDFLRDCLDSEYNLIQANFPDKAPEQRKCTAGLLQEAKINKEAFLKLKAYLDNLLKSKRALLFDIEEVETRAEKEWELKKEIYTSEARAIVDTQLATATRGLLERDEQKVDRGLRGVKGVFLTNVQKFHTEYQKYLERDREYDRQMKKIDEQINSIIEKGAGIGIAPLEKQFNHIQDMRGENQAKFKMEYAKIRPYLLLPLEETSKVQNIIEKLKPGERGVTEAWRDKVSKKFENSLREMIALGESKVPKFKEDFREQTDLKRLSNIQDFIKEIQEDDRIDKTKLPGNANLLKRNIGIWVPYKIDKGRFAINTYGLFNILTGTDIPGIKSRITALGTIFGSGLGGVIKDIRDRKFRGVIIIGKEGSNEWYYASPPPTITNIKDESDIQKLNAYRYELFKTYGIKNDMIIKDEGVKEAIFVYANYPTNDSKIQTLRTTKPIPCTPDGGPVTSCLNLVNMNDMKDVIMNVSKQYERRNATDISFERLISNKGLIGGTKNNKKMVKRKVKRSAKKSIKRSTKKSGKKSTLKKQTKIVKKRVSKKKKTY